MKHRRSDDKAPTTSWSTQHALRRRKRGLYGTEETYWTVCMLPPNYDNPWGRWRVTAYYTIIPSNGAQTFQVHYDHYVKNERRVNMAEAFDLAARGAYELAEQEWRRRSASQTALGLFE